VTARGRDWGPPLRQQLDVHPANLRLIGRRSIDYVRRMWEYALSRLKDALEAEAAANSRAPLSIQFATVAATISFAPLREIDT